MKQYRYNLLIRVLRKLSLYFRVYPRKPVINFYGFRFQLDLSQDGISRTIYTNRVREIDHSTLFKGLIANKTKCLDLGANIGYYMFFTLAHADKNASVLCIEPDSRNTNVLAKNIRLNALESRVTMIEGAVSDRSGDITIEIRDASNLNKLKLDSSNTGSTHSTLVDEHIVKSWSLDDIFEKYGAFESVRMDIEGAESLVFQGQSLKFLNAMPHGAAIFMEVHPEDYMPSSEHMAAALNNLRQSGFNKFGFVSSGKKPHDVLRSMCGESKDIFIEGGFERHHFDNVDFESWKEVALMAPKKVRYIYCVKS